MPTTLADLVKEPPTLVEVLSTSPNGRHSWYRTSDGQRVRKPAGLPLGTPLSRRAVRLTRAQVEQLVKRARAPFLVRLWRVLVVLWVMFVRLFTKRK